MAGDRVLEVAAADVERDQHDRGEGQIGVLGEQRRVQARERLARRALLRVGAQRVAQQRGLDGRLQPAAADVAHGDQHAPGSDLQDVVEVAAHARRARRRPVLHADLGAGQQRRLDEQGLLEGLGDLVLALKGAHVAQRERELRGERGRQAAVVVVEAVVERAFARALKDERGEGVGRVGD